MNRLSWRIPLALAILFSGCAPDTQAAPAATTNVVYEYSPDRFKPAPGNPWNGEAVNRPDGTRALRVNSTGLGYNNYLFVPANKFKPGQEYTAILKYEIVAPAAFPDSFHLFFRSSKLGMRQDAWQVWNGDVGEKGIAKLTLSIKGTRESDDWALYGGAKGPSSIIIDSFKVVEGNGLDYTPATKAAKPAASVQTNTKLPTGAENFTVDPPAKNGPALNAKDFGLAADGANGPVSTEVAVANNTAIAAALKVCKERKASILTIPTGVYRFGAKMDIPFADLTDLVIDGQGSEFIFQNLHNGIPAVSVQRCQRVVVKNLKLDWDWNVTPIASLSKIVSGSEDKKSYDLTFPDLNEMELDATAKAPWTYLFPMDPVTLTSEIGANEMHSIKVDAIEKVDGKTLRVKFKDPVALRTGAHYCVRHLYYNFECFKVSSSSNLVFDGVTIYSNPGMGWFYTGDMYKSKLVNCRIVRREGTRRPLTTAADGFHISQSKGNIALENCEFSGSGDDSINIHDNCYQGVRRVDDKTLTLVKCPPWRLRLQVGDKIELFRHTYEPLGFISEVKTVEFKDGDTTVTLADTLPADLSPLTIVQNKRFDTHNVRIANSTFHDTNGRGILISGRNVSIENNTFKNVNGTAIQLHTEIVGNLWAEGSGVQNAVIRGNTFENTSFSNRYDSAVVYSGAKLTSGITKFPLYRDILIEKNRFVNSSGPAVSLTSAKDIIVRDNQLLAPKPLRTSNYLANALLGAHASEVAFNGNTWQSSSETGKTGVVLDTSTTSNISTTGNVVLGTP